MSTFLVVMINLSHSRLNAYFIKKYIVMERRYENYYEENGRLLA